MDDVAVGSFSFETSAVEAVETLRAEGIDAGIRVLGPRAYEIVVPADQEDIAGEIMATAFPMTCPIPERMAGSRLGSIRDVPFPPNIERPEMWDLEAVVRAIKDGFTFNLPFKDKRSLGTPNAYWIAGQQYIASSLTVGPDHTPEAEILPTGWLRVKTFFPPPMVPKKAWLNEPNQFGVVPVHVEIDPDTIDWDLLNRGYQIRAPRGLL